MYLRHRSYQYSSTISRLHTLTFEFSNSPFQKNNNNKKQILLQNNLLSTHHHLHQLHRHLLYYHQLNLLPFIIIPFRKINLLYSNTNHVHLSIYLLHQHSYQLTTLQTMKQNNHLVSLLLRHKMIFFHLYNGITKNNLPFGDELTIVKE